MRERQKEKEREREREGGERKREKTKFDDICFNTRAVACLKHTEQLLRCCQVLLTH